MIIATHLATATKVEVGSFKDLASRTGIDLKDYYAQKLPRVFGGWSIEVLQELLDKRKTLQAVAPKGRGRRYFNVQVYRFSTGEFLGRFDSPRLAAQHFGVPANMVLAVLRKERRQYADLIFKDDSVDTVRQELVSTRRYLLTFEDGRQERVVSQREASLRIGCHVVAVNTAIRLARPIKGVLVEKEGKDIPLERLKNSLYAYYRMGQYAPQLRRRFMMSKEEFSEILHSPEFEAVYARYEDSNFIPALKPCLDRRDPRLPYTVENVQWLSTEANQAKIAEDRRILAGYFHFITDRPDEVFQFAADAERAFIARQLSKTPFQDRPSIDLRPR